MSRSSREPGPDALRRSRCCHPSAQRHEQRGDLHRGSAGRYPTRAWLSATNAIAPLIVLGRWAYLYDWDPTIRGYGSSPSISQAVLRNAKCGAACSNRCGSRRPSSRLRVASTSPSGLACGHYLAVHALGRGDRRDGCSRQISGLGSYLFLPLAWTALVRGQVIAMADDRITAPHPPTGEVRGPSPPQHGPDRSRERRHHRRRRNRGGGSIGSG